MPIVIIDVAPTRILELQRLLESSPFRNDVIIPSNAVPEARTARTSAKIEHMIVDLREDIESMHEMLLKVATEAYTSKRRKEKHRPWKPDHWRK